MSDISRKLLFVLVALLLLLILISIAYYRSLSFLPFAAGAFLGFLANALKVIMLDQTVRISVSMEANKAGNYVRIQYFLRMLLTGLVLVLSAFLPFINIAGAVAGILTLHVALLLMKYTNGFHESKTNATQAPENGGE